MLLSWPSADHRARDKLGKGSIASLADVEGEQQPPRTDHRTGHMPHRPRRRTRRPAIRLTATTID
jgi:hypothetical protein